MRHERNKSSTHHGVFDVFNRLQEDRSGSDGTMMMLLLLLMMVVVLLLMLMLMVMVLLVVRIAIGDIRAGAAAANVAGLLAGEEVSYQAGGDRCCRRVVDAVQQGRRQRHRTTRDKRVRMKIRGDGGTCLVGAYRLR